MTPDMRRLALAVARVRWHDPESSDEDWTDEALANFDCEAIVRAVLTELREVSKESVAQGTDVWYSALMEDATGVIQDYVDGILAEPATA